MATDVSLQKRRNPKRTDWARKAIIAVVLAVTIIPLLVVVPAVTGDPRTAVGTFIFVAVMVAWELRCNYQQAKRLNTRQYLLGLGVLLVGGMLAGALLAMMAGLLGIVVILLVAAGNVPTDVGAQLIGRKWGNRRLPEPLDNKTVEGIGGGIAMGWIGGTLAFTLVHLLWMSLPMQLLLIVVFTPPLAMAGDVAESWVKRKLEIPDMSRILGEHGGFCERADSPALPLLFAAVVVGFL